MTLDKHEYVSKNESISSDRTPTNISIKTTEKENRTQNYLEILDMKFNKKIRPIAKTRVAAAVNKVKSKE